MNTALLARALDMLRASKVNQYTRTIRETTLIPTATVPPDILRKHLFYFADAVAAVMAVHGPTLGHPHPLCAVCAVDFPCLTRKVLNACLLFDDIQPGPRAGSTDPYVRGGR